MEKDNKKAGRHHALRLKKKQRATKLEMLYTFLQKYHPDVLAKFEQFYGSGSIPTSATTTSEKSPSLEATEFKDDINTTPESQDILPTTTGDNVPWPITETPGPEQSSYLWDDSLPELSDVDFDLEAYFKRF